MTQNEQIDIFANIPEDIIFPDELNRYLKDEITVLVQENGLLRQNLERSCQNSTALENELSQLKKKLKSLENPLLPSFASASQNINSKVIELSKNLREKCAELEKYKTKCSKLTTVIEELKNKENEPNRTVEPVKEIGENASQEKVLLEKLNTATYKILDLKNLNLQLRNDLRQANKLLQQEIGEDLQTLQSNGNWKGRAQIISDLQEKNRKLKEKLKNTNNAEQDSKNCETRISSKICLLEKENAQLKTQNETMKNKIDSLKSRCQMLESEQHMLKLRVQDVKDRSSKDLDLLSNMSKQLTEAEHLRKNSVREKDVEITKLRSEISNLNSHIENYKMLIDKLKSQQGEPKNDAQTQQIISDVEQEKIKLLDLLAIYKNKLEKERNEHEKLEQQFRMERQKTVKLEAAVAKSELESLSTSRSRYSTMSQSINAENNLKNQLELAEENLKTLKTRLLLEQNERKRDFQEFAKVLSSRIKM